VDGGAFIRWHLFGANMTGNTVLFAIAVAQHDVARAAETFTPIVAFCTGCVVAFLALRGGRPVWIPLVFEAVVLAVAAFVDSSRQLALIAFAIGVQSSSLATFAEVRANTGFITGDYTEMVRAAMNWAFHTGDPTQRDTVAVLAPLIATYAVAAFCATLAAPVRHNMLFVVPLVLAIAYTQSRSHAASP
jgi:uncharacterized membrane protein YoaK (UPF0700 family)